MCSPWHDGNRVLTTWQILSDCEWHCWTLIGCFRLSRPGSEKIYYFSQLAIQMNEMEDGVALTDSRRRPDQRLMEDGKWEEANRCKFLLEEKQRAVRRRRESESENVNYKGE